MDESRHDTTHRLDPEGERHDVEKEHVLRPAGEDIRLHGRAERDHLIRVDVDEWLGAEQFPHDPANEGHARRSADHDHRVDLFRVDRGISARAPA